MKQILRSALQARGYTTLTPVQEAVTAEELGQSDLLVSAQTGSGKTVGFGLAIAPAVLGEAESFGPPGAPLALIIAPTRELALQVRRELEWLYGPAGAVLASCVGGMDPRAERRALERGAHILVATPGRLCDHLRRGAVDLYDLRAVVLDEADEMLDLGFREDLETILDAAPEGRQTLMFSATVSPAIAELAKRFQRDARRISVQAGAGQHADIDYRAVMVAPHDEENAITNLLRFHEAPNAIVFANTRAAVSRLVSRLSNRGFVVVGLSGELSQEERSHALQAMRDGRARVCVATDVAARGIDLPSLDLVIHAELPQSDETLLHRSGRTGRAGRKGISALIVPPRAVKKAERMLAAAKLSAVWEAAPSAEAVLARDEARLRDDPIWQDPPNEEEARSLSSLTAAHDAEALALAVLRMWRGQRSAPEELLPVTPRVAPGTAFGPSRWFSVPIGRNRKTSPKWLMPKICEAGEITRHDIGAIRIGADESYVEIAEGVLAGFLDALGPEMEVAPGLALTPLDAPPRLGQRFAGPKGGRMSKPGGKPFGKPGVRREARDAAPPPARPAREMAPERASEPSAGARPEGRPARGGAEAGGKAVERKPRHGKARTPAAETGGERTPKRKPRFDRPENGGGSDRPKGKYPAKGFRKGGAGGPKGGSKKR